MSVFTTVSSTSTTSIRWGATLDPSLVFMNESEFIRFAHRGMRATRYTRRFVNEGARILNERRPWWKKILNIRYNPDLLYDEWEEILLSYIRCFDSQLSGSVITINRSIIHDIQSWIDFEDHLISMQQSSPYR